jgi:hypothetical protein
MESAVDAALTQALNDARVANASALIAPDDDDDDDSDSVFDAAPSLPPPPALERPPALEVKVERLSMSTSDDESGSASKPKLAGSATMFSTSTDIVKPTGVAPTPATVPASSANATSATATASTALSVSSSDDDAAENAMLMALQTQLEARTLPPAIVATSATATSSTSSVKIPPLTLSTLPPPPLPQSGVLVVDHTSPSTSPRRMRTATEVPAAPPSEPPEESKAVKVCSARARVCVLTLYM